MRTVCSLKGSEAEAKGQNAAGRAGAVPVKGPVSHHPSKVSRTGPRVKRGSTKSLDLQASPWW